MTTPLGDLIDYREALALAGVSPPTLRAALYRGDLHGRLLGGRWVFLRADVEEYARRRVVAGRPRSLQRVNA
jgi:helix-turn-helix protein